MKPDKAYATPLDESGDWFAFAEDPNDREILNFWHTTPEYTYMYSFRQNDQCNCENIRSPQGCKKLLEDLQSPQPSVCVLRFAAEGKVLMGKELGECLPDKPKGPAKPRSKKNRRTRAPYILYGRAHGREYVCRLIPDKPIRQDIQPGDVVWISARKFGLKIKVTRIEPAGPGRQPRYLVNKKVKKRNTDVSEENGGKQGEPKDQHSEKVTED